MTLAATLLAGLLIGALATWLLMREDLTYLRDELRVAHAQIAHAVMSEGAQVPPRIEEIEPPKPLTSELQACVDEWEDPESRAVEELKIRGWLAEGRAIKSILRQYGAGQ